MCARQRRKNEGVGEKVCSVHKINKYVRETKKGVVLS